MSVLSILIGGCHLAVHAVLGRRHHLSALSGRSRLIILSVLIGRSQLPGHAVLSGRGHLCVALFV